MELNHDLVRSLLLEIEKNKSPQGMSFQDSDAFMNSHSISHDQLAYTVQKLKEANFITGTVRWANNQPLIIIPGNLTYIGHEYLDNIRDPKVWGATKKAASKVTSVSLPVMGQLALSILKSMLGL